MSVNIIYDKFTNGELNEYFPQLDTDGNIINASDGGMIFVDGRYYWYGSHFVHCLWHLWVRAVRQRRLELLCIVRKTCTIGHMKV